MLNAIKHKKKEQKKYVILPSIIGIEYEQEPIDRPNGLEAYQIFYCRKGYGQLRINGRKFLVNPGQIMILMAGDRHSYRSEDNNKWKVDLIALVGKCCPEILKGLGIHESGVYQMDGSFHAFSYYLKDILTAETPLEQSKKTYCFLLDLACHIKKKNLYEVSDESPIVRGVLDYLDEHMSEAIGLEDIANSLGISKEYMCSLFKAEVGQTIITFLTNMRIGKARQELVNHSEKSIIEIAHLCGYENPSYFGKVFREIVGTSPGEYRK